MFALIRKSVVTLTLAATLALPALAAAQVHVDGYMRRDGTYVQPHYRPFRKAPSFRAGI